MPNKNLSGDNKSKSYDFKKSNKNKTFFQFGYALWP